MLITIEGVDCSGKETQAKLLCERLREKGHSATQFSFPAYSTPTGKILAGPYLGKNDDSFFPEGASNVDPYVGSLLFAADRKYNLELLKNMLNEYDFVILDRYVFSNMAHQGCKFDESERANFFTFIETLEFELLGMPKPDLCLFLYLSDKTVADLKSGRAEKPDDHEKDAAYLARARETYHSLAKKYGFVTIDCEKVGKIKSPGEISDEIFYVIFKYE